MPPGRMPRLTLEWQRSSSEYAKTVNVLPEGKVGGDPKTPGLGGVGAALDPLIQKIVASVRTKPTVILWLFDASLSLKSRRNLVADRFEKIQRQVDALQPPKSTGLSTVVASYGKGF